MKRILVTGGAGMIGTNLVKELLRQDYEVLVIDNYYRGKKENLESLGFNFDNFLLYDLSEGISDKLLDFCKNIEIVYHLADIVAGIGYVFKNESDIFNQNVKINTTIADLINKATIPKIIYAGTACSFPESLQSNYSGYKPLSEDQLFPASPESGYGWSKLIGQLQYKYLSQKNGIEAITLMFHNVYGFPCDFSEERSQVIPSLVRKVSEAKDGGELVVWGSGNQSRAFVHVRDVVKALIKVLDVDCSINDTIQIGPTESTSIKNIATTLVELSGSNLDIKFDLTKPEGDKARCSDNVLAKKILDWEPEVSIQEGLAELLDYYGS